MQVQINFLPVGHMHEDVDQLFSKIGEEIRKTGSESLPGDYQIPVLVSLNFTTHNYNTLHKTRSIGCNSPKQYSTRILMDGLSHTLSIWKAT